MLCYSDISDRKRLEASLKSFLTSVMADMRQPLTGIQAAAELLAQHKCIMSDEEASFMVSAISASSNMLGCIVANVLSLRLLEAGDTVITAAPFSVHDMVAGA